VIVSRAHLALVPQPSTVQCADSSATDAHVLDVATSGISLLHPVACRAWPSGCAMTHACGQAPEFMFPLGQWACHVDSEGRVVYDRPATAGDLAACGVVVTVGQVCAALARVDWQKYPLTPATDQSDRQRRAVAEQVAAALNTGRSR
jgi:hypothetical protein